MAGGVSTCFLGVDTLTFSKAGSNLNCRNFEIPKNSVFKLRKTTA